MELPSFQINAHYVEHVFLLTIYLCLIPQPHKLSKRITAFRVLIVAYMYLYAIEEFVQQVNCFTNDPTLRVNCNTMTGQL